MGIKGTLSRVATVGGRVAGTGNLRAKQVAIGNTANVDISAKSIQELSDVTATETDDGRSKKGRQKTKFILLSSQYFCKKYKLDNLS